MSETAKWYVIHTYSGYENKVAQDIEKVVENRKLHDMIGSAGSHRKGNRDYRQQNPRSGTEDISELCTSQNDLYR